MEKRKISFNFKHGNVEGIYLDAGDSNSPLVIITNGHNGFYGYGMFPYIQEQLQARNISSFSYNFSHGGIEGSSDYFTRIDLYEKNCMRLETQDLYEIVKHLPQSSIKVPAKNRLILLSHSLGSVPTIFAAKKMLEEGLQIDGIVLIAPTMTLDFWSKNEMEEWEKNGVLLLKNKRTNQELPQGREYLEETKQANGIWSVKEALKKVKTRFLIIHGDKDEAIPIQEAITINSWNKENGNPSELKIIENAGHTYNSKHPFQGPSKELNFMIEEVSSWIKKL